MFKNRAWLLNLIGDEAPRDISEVPRAQNQRCYPHTEMAGTVGV